MKYKKIAVLSKFGFLLALVLGGCTYYVPAKLETKRAGDMLTVALAGPGAARWDPRKDSLVIDCAGCTEEAARQVEHFADSNTAEYDIVNSQNLTLTLYTMGHRQVLALPGVAEATAVVGKPRLMRHRYHAVASESAGAVEARAAAEAKAAAAKAAARALQKVTMLKVTAPEGIAIYSDKTKRYVLKILPQGSKIVLLAKEGDLYSVSVDGQEGFVDAEAVEIEQ